ncbi:MAG: ABC transporter ATP-binding protein [Candidatus Heimdallarchaeaceae archaeon]
MNVIEVRNLSKAIEGREILSKIRFSVSQGERFGIFGPSGCGKTMLLRCICGLEKIDSGEVYLRGKEATSKRTFVPPEERNVAMIFQELALWPHMTVKDHIQFVLKSKSGETKKRMREILKTVGLEKKLNSKPSQLSGGERQRLAIARAIAQDSDILLLDEPFSSLDFKLKKEIGDLIMKIQETNNITVVYVSHDILEVMRFCNKVALMENGKIKEIGKPNKLLAKFLEKTNIQKL